MAQNQNIGLFGQYLTVNSTANTITFPSTSRVIVGNSSVNVVINSSSVYVSGSPLGSGGGGSFDVNAQYAWTNTQSFSNTITFTGAILANTINAASYSIGTAVSINSTSMAVNAFSIGNSNTATFYNINGQANASAGAFVGNAYATLGGASGNYLAFGQQLNSAQWVQSGYSSAGAPVYYSIILNPLGGNIGIGNTAPSNRLSVNGTTYLQGNVTFTQGIIDSTGTQGTAGQVLTSNGVGNVYWSTSGFTNGQSISVDSLTITGPLTANGSTGTSTFILASNGATGSPYWRDTVRVNSQASASSLTIDANLYDMYVYTALAANWTFNASTSATNGEKVIIRIKDNGTPRTLTWPSSSVAGGVRQIGLTLPVITNANKTIYIGLVYNTDGATALWDAIAYSLEA